MDEANVVKTEIPGTVTLLEDTRQQEGKHRNVEAYCKRMGIRVVRQKLEVGDYMLPGGTVSVDSKESILEICHNVMSDDHKRFKAECIRARTLGIQLIVLTEEVPPFGRLDMWEVPMFKSTDRFHKYGDPMTLVHPAHLRKALITMQERYGVKFRFCTRRQSPARIIKYLKGELK
jgi:ribosome-associated protein